MPTYATVTGQLVIPGTTDGVPGSVEAVPLTEGKVLTFPDDNITTLGAAVAQVAADGTLTPALEIPTDVPEGTLWRFTFKPKGRALPTHLGDVAITASTDIADLNLSATEVTHVTPTVAANIAAAAALGATNDSATASFIENEASATSVALSATIATEATPIADAAVLARENRLSWVDGSAQFRDGFYRCEPHAGATARDRFTDAITGVGRFHVGALGDSTTHIAGETDPAHEVSWPARLRDQMERTYGLTWGGTGWVWLWDTYGSNPVPATPFTEPRLTFNYSGGTLSQVANLGLYGHACLAVTTNAARTGGFVDFTPERPTDELWVILAGGGTPTRLLITNTNDPGDTYQIILPAHYGAAVSDAGWISWALEDGYVRGANPAADGGLRVAKITLPKQAWSVRVMSNDDTGPSYLLAVRGVDSAGTLEVTNAAQAGRSLNDLYANANENSGYGGGPLIDAMQLNLALIAFGLNDWQGHGSVSTFAAQLTETIQRQRFTGATGVAGEGVGASGDAMLVVQPQPDYGNHPPDLVNVPPLVDYWSQQYAVADTQGVPLVDNAWAWVDYATSAALFRDFIHPNNKGAADIGLRVARGLAAVVGGA